MKNTSAYRILAVWVLVLAMLSPILFSLHFYVERVAHRMYMWYEADHENLETIKLDSASILWVKKDREIILFWKYFDVVSITFQQGKATIKGFFDHKETEMHRVFETATHKNKDSHWATQKLVHWLQTSWHSYWQEITFRAPLMDFKPTSGFKDSFILLCKLPTPHLPPWKCI